MRLSHREIIKEAWEFTQNNKSLIIWYAVPSSIFATVVGIGYLFYQYFAIISSPLVENWEHSFTMVFLTQFIEFLRDNLSLSFPIIITLIILGVLYLVVPSFCEGAIIQIIARKRNNQAVRMRDGIRYGLLSFLPLFEYSWLVRTFSLASLLSWTSFVGRNLGWGALNAILPVMIFVAIVGIILTLIFTYSEFFIVIDDNGVIQSISKSATLVVTHLEETLLLSILMLIISIRIIIQLVFILLIPLVITLVIYFAASSTVPIVAIGIGGFIGLILLYVASYLNGTIHVFAAAVWTFTFLELTQQDVLSARDKSETGEGSRCTNWKLKS